MILPPFHSQELIKIPDFWKRLPLGAIIPLTAKFQWKGEWVNSKLEPGYFAVNSGGLRYIIPFNYKPYFESKHKEYLSNK